MPKADCYLEILECLRRIKGFKDRKNWTAENTFAEVTTWILSEVRRVVPKGYDWVVFSDGSSTEITYYKEYHQYEGFCGVALEWLPDYKKENPELYWIIVNIIGRLICAHDLRFESEYEEMCLDDWNFDGDEDDLFMQDRNKYRVGGAKFELGQLLYKYGRQNSAAACVSSIESYKPRTSKQRDVHAWLKKAIPILQSNFCLSDYNFFPDDPNHENGIPVLPTDYFAFEWSWNDRVYEKIEMWRNDLAGSCGVASPCVVGVFSPDKHTPPADIEGIRLLRNFMQAGVDLYVKYYSKKFENYYAKRSEQSTL